MTRAHQPPEDALASDEDDVPRPESAFNSREDYTSRLSEWRCQQHPPPLLHRVNDRGSHEATITGDVDALIIVTGLLSDAMSCLENPSMTVTSVMPRFVTSSLSKMRIKRVPRYFCPDLKGKRYYKDYPLEWFRQSVLAKMTGVGMSFALHATIVVIDHDDVPATCQLKTMQKLALIAALNMARDPRNVRGFQQVGAAIRDALVQSLESMAKFEVGLGPKQSQARGVEKHLPHPLSTEYVKVFERALRMIASPVDQWSYDYSHGAYTGINGVNRKDLQEAASYLVANSFYVSQAVGIKGHWVNHPSDTVFLDRKAETNERMKALAGRCMDDIRAMVSPAGTCRPTSFMVDLAINIQSRKDGACLGTDGIRSAFAVKEMITWRRPAISPGGRLRGAPSVARRPPEDVMGRWKC